MCFVLKSVRSYTQTENRWFYKKTMDIRKGMNRKFDIKTDLGDKELVRAKCIICNGSYFEVLIKGKKKAPYTFVCEECKPKLTP